MSGFASIQTALSGLMAQQRAIEVTGHNITNAETAGYTRRRIDLKPAGLGSAASVWSTDSNYGGGVDVAGVTRVRDEFLDVRQRRESSVDVYTSRTASVLSSIEGLMPEPSDTGIAAQLSALWGAWDDAAADPANIATRGALLEQASTVAQAFSRVVGSLVDYRASLESDLEKSVAQINADAASMAELNSAIRAALASGSDAHDLLDRRDLCVDRLTRATGATFRDVGDGTVTVSLGGIPLVSEVRSNPMAVISGGSLTPPLDATGMTGVRVQWAVDGYPVSQLGGSLGATLNAVTDTVPRWLHELDGVAAQVVTQVNDQHITGHGLDPVNDVGLNFFDPSGLTASHMRVSTDVAGAPSRIVLGAAGSGDLDASLGHTIAALADSRTGPDVWHRSLVGRLGIEVSNAASRAEIQSTVAQQATSDRQAMTSVSMDEELTSLVAAEKAYEASARVMTAVDQLLDVLINRTGLVGR